MSFKLKIKIMIMMMMMLMMLMIVLATVPQWKVNEPGQKFRQFRTHLHHILVSTVQICKPMIQNNVEKFRPIHGLSFTQQSNFDMLNNFLRNQLKKAASVPDFSSTSVKNWAV